MQRQQGHEPSASIFRRSQTRFIMLDRLVQGCRACKRTCKRSPARVPRRFRRESAREDHPPVLISCVTHPMVGAARMEQRPLCFQNHGACKFTYQDATSCATTLYGVPTQGVSYRHFCRGRNTSRLVTCALVSSSNRRRRCRQASLTSTPYAHTTDKGTASLTHFVRFSF